MSKTILFQPPNQIGLGHINRLAAIALALSERDPSARVIFAVEGGDHQLLQSLGLAHVSLIPRSLLNSQEWRRWPVSYRAKILRSVALSLLRSLAPDAILCDCHPYPPLVRAANNDDVPTALCIRKMSDWDAYVKRLGEMADAFRLVIFPHEPGEFEPPARFRACGRFVGEVVRPGLRERKRLNKSRGNRVVISGGAGGYQGTVEFYNLAMRAIAAIRATGCDVEATLITGPMFLEWRSLALIDGIKIAPFEPDLPALLNDASVVICQAGYNTIAEIAQIGVPAICVPSPRFLDDQAERAAKAAAELEGFFVVQPADLPELCRILVHALNLPPRAEKPRRPTAAGALRAADLILEMVSR